MNEKYHCEDCSYFFGKEGIHCAVHPYGKESDSCSDWQPKKLSLQEENLMKLLNADTKIKILSGLEVGKYILLVGVTLLFGYKLYQDLPSAIRADQNYDIYKKGCEIFLERASKAGTTKVASVELTKGVDWLESNSLTQKFEYKDLKANLDYLNGQPGNIAMPVTISNSISSNFENIKNKQIELQMSYWNNLYRLIGQFTLVCILILFFIAVLEVCLELWQK